MIFVYKSKKHVKLKMLLLFYLILIISVLLFNFYLTTNYGGLFKENLIETVIIGSLFIIYLITVPTGWIKNKILFDVMELDTVNKIVKIGCNTKLIVYEAKSLEFSKFDYKYYSVLAIYNAKSDQALPHEIAHFTAFIINISWSRKQLSEMAEKLKDLPVNVGNGFDVSTLDRIF